MESEIGRRVNVGSLFIRQKKGKILEKGIFYAGIFNKNRGRKFLVAEESNTLEFGCHMPYLKFWQSVIL
jgi:hypothetical protein